VCERERERKKENNREIEIERERDTRKWKRWRSGRRKKLCIGKRI